MDIRTCYSLSLYSRTPRFSWELINNTSLKFPLEQYAWLLAVISDYIPRLGWYKTISLLIIERSTAKSTPGLRRTLYVKKGLESICKGYSKKDGNWWVGSVIISCAIFAMSNILITIEVNTIVKIPGMCLLYCSNDSNPDLFLKSLSLNSVSSQACPNLRG